MNPNVIGGDDVKHHDDKEIDVGEVSSPSAEVEVVDDPNKVVDERIIPVEREFKIEDESDKKDGDSSGSSSSSSSSSSSNSDDESHGIDNSQAAPDVGSIVDSVKVTDSLSGGQGEVIHSTTIEEAHAVEENIVDIVSVNVQSLTEEPEVSLSSPANDSVPPPVAESIFNENEEKKLSSFEAKVGISEALHDAVSQREEAVITPVENITATPDPKECIAQETDDRLNLSYNAPIAIADLGADLERDSGVTEVILVFFLILAYSSLCCSLYNCLSTIMMQLTCLNLFLFFLNLFAAVASPYPPSSANILEELLWTF